MTNAMNTMNTGYYVIGGKYSTVCYGHCETLDEARELAEAKAEFWSNCHGEHIPAVYYAKDCEMSSRGYIEPRIVPKTSAEPVPCPETKCEKLALLVKSITRTDNKTFKGRRVWDFEFALIDGKSVVIQLWDSYNSSMVHAEKIVAEPHNNPTAIRLDKVPTNVLLDLFVQLYPVHPDSDHPGWMVRYCRWPFPNDVCPYQAVPRSVEEAAMISIYGSEMGAEINEENRWADAHALFGCKTRNMAFEICSELTKPGEPPFRWDSRKVLSERASALGGQAYTIAFTKGDITRCAELHINRRISSGNPNVYHLSCRPTVLTAPCQQEVKNEV